MSLKQISKRNKWSVDFTTPSKNALQKPRTDIRPAGYTDQKSTLSTKQSMDSKLISKRSWNIALGPIKQVPMNLFIMYMSGNSISIFPIMIIGMMIFRPIKAIMAYKGTFKMLEVDSQAILQKIVWLLGNLLGVCAALWKCQALGLLPTSPSDWLAFKEHRERVEYVIGGMSM